MNVVTHNGVGISVDVLPGGVGRSSLAYSVGDGPLPRAASASGYTITDNSGRELLDVNNNMTVNLHGHAHPVVMQAVRRQMEAGLVSLGLANDAEYGLAQILLDRLPWGDWVRFANTGTEAVMLAVRLARAFTGRDEIVVHNPGYHGFGEAVLPSMGDYGRRGTYLGSSVNEVTPRDIEGLEKVFRERGERIAALVLDVCSSRAGMIPHSQEYVDRARELTRQYGALLIVDEVVTFRVGLRGLLHSYGVTPDLMTLGKTIGGGFPIGAVVGTAALRGMLEASDPAHIEHGGTFTSNPITMAAGIASLTHYTESLSEHLNNLGLQLEARVLDEGIEGTGWAFRRVGSVFRLWPLVGGAGERAEAQADIYRALYVRGLLSAGSGLSCLSTVMTESVVDQIASVVVDAARETKKR